MKPLPDAPVPDGFSADWLGLRESFDAAARATAAQSLRLVPRLQHWRSGREGPWRVIDLGCGTGSNLRWLAPHLGDSQQWLAVDHDPALLNAWPLAFAAAGLRLQVSTVERMGLVHGLLPEAPVQVVRRCLDLSADLEALPWHHAELITGSALIDLVGASWLARLVACCRSANAALYLSLSVNGRHRWAPADRDDAWVSRVFADHQQRDKGFGPALGARAVPVLLDLLRASGYRVFQARSDWQVDAVEHPGGESLMNAMVDGMAQAVREQSPASDSRVQGWRLRRLTSHMAARLAVGHVDVLALPPSPSRRRSA